MRKILLASVATLGAAGWAGLAAAQAPMAPNQGQFVATPLPYGAAAANNNNNYQATMTPPGTAMATGGQIAVSAGFMATPTPGTIVIHLGGKVDAEIQANFTSLDRGVTAAGPNGTTYSTNKIQPVGIGSFMRLYPGVDGMAANGLRYGASVEIRQNFMSGNSYGFTGTNTTTTAAGNTIGTAAASPSGQSSAQTLFVRRAFTYLAGDQWGLVRLGTTDGVLGLFDNCIFTAQCWDYGIGTANGGANQQMFPSNASPPFVWLSQAGAEYDNAKVVYLTPQFFGFDFGVQYSPQMGNAYQDSVGGSPVQAAPCGSAATGGCVLQSSGGIDGSRWLNQVAVGGRYQGSFAGFEPKAYVMYETAGKVDYTGAVPVVNGTASAANNNRRFDNLSFVSAGVALSFAGFTASADYIGGAINSQLAMRPTGGASMSAPLFGLKYTAGPLTVGSQLGFADYQGANQMVGVSQRHAMVAGVGGYYVIAPGMGLVLEYTYDQLHQGGVNLATGAVGTGAFNDIKAQGVLFGTVVNW
jgi:hypothetical protein